MISLREAIFTHPEYLAMACFAWVAIVIWVVGLVGWMIQGDVDGLFGLAGITVALMLGYFSIRPPVEIVRPFTALAAVVTVIIFPMLRRALNQRALLAIDVEAMENAYEMLRMKPDNTMMQFKLGRLLYERGHVDAGLAVVGEALKGMPERLFTEEYRMYGRWRRNNPNAQVTAKIPCIECGYANPPTSIFCERCNHTYLVDIVRGRWVGRQFAKKLIAAWIASILALAGIPLASTLAPAGAITVIASLMFAAIALVWLAFRGGEKSVPGAKA